MATRRPSETEFHGRVYCTHCGQAMAVDLSLRVLKEEGRIPAGYDMNVSEETGEVSYEPKTHRSEPRDPKTPGEWFRKFREDTGITMGDMARLISITVEEVSSIERDRDSPYQVSEIFTIAKSVGINANGLLNAACVPPSKWGKEKPGWSTFMQIQKFNAKAEEVFRGWLISKGVSAPEMLPKEVLVAVLPEFKDAVKARKRKLKKKRKRRKK
jgi:transcriptional regulator with XRE-family HTH domain